MPDVRIGSVLTVPNVRRFILFRIFFGARFYYPVFAIMFLDFGLTLAQFAVLNTVWAAAIVCLEVPSGALADLIGRKRLVVAAAALMIAEMLVLALVPLGNQPIVFWAFLLNRILSGAAEACASGADEALAYDSLAAVGRRGDWPKVLDYQMRGQAIAMMVAMIVGAAVYDPTLVERVTGFAFPATTTLRFPIYLTLLTAVAALITAGRLQEKFSSAAAHETWRQIVRAGQWICSTRFALVVIVVAVSFDSITRLFLTLGSKYYRLIGLPDGSFGLISTGLALVGFVAPILSRKLVEQRSRAMNFWIVAGLIELGLIGVAAAWPYWGLMWVVPTVLGFYMAAFLASHYLNEITDSAMRATVLSFRGLAQNLGYGCVNLLFGGLMALLARLNGGSRDTFAAALTWLPWTFGAIVAVLAFWIPLQLATRRPG